MHPNFYTFLAILSGTQLSIAAPKVVLFGPSIRTEGSFFNSFPKKSPHVQIKSALARALIFFLQLQLSVVVRGPENPVTILRVLQRADGL